MSDITIRTARPADALALGHLAQLDSQRLPSGDLLVAEVGGEIVAAYEPAGSRSIANPFRPTARIVEMLRLRAADAVSTTRRERRGLLAALPRLA